MATAPAIEVIDAMDPNFLDADVATPGPGYSLKITGLAHNREIVEELPRAGMGEILIKRRAWILVAMGCLPLVLMLFVHIAKQSGVPAHAFKDDQVDPLPSGIGLWLCLFVMWQVSRRRPKCFRINGDQLELKTVGRKRGQFWRRDGIEAVHVAHYASANGHVSAGIALEPKQTILPFIVSGDVMAMRYLAATLRSELGVPARAPNGDDGIHDIAWHLKDDRQPPRGCTLLHTTDADETIIQRPAAGYSGPFLSYAIFFGLFVLAGIVSAIARAFSTDPITKRGTIAAAIGLGGFGLFGIAVAVYEAKRSFEFVITQESFISIRKSVFGTRINRWAREGLNGIGTTPPSRPGRDIPLKAALTGGKKKTLITGRPQEMRYLAVLLRDALQIPPITEDARSVHSEPVRILRNAV
jgi:hypothetical protein